MNDVLLATIGGLAAFLCWGSSDWLAARSSKEHDSYDVNLALRPPGLLVSLVLLAVSYRQVQSFGELVPMIAAGILASIAYIFMIKALSTGSVGIVTPIISINPLITLVMALVLTDQLIAGRQVLSMLLIIAGILLLAYRKNSQKIPLKELHRETFLAFMSAIFWGLAFFVVDVKVGSLPWQLTYSVFSLTMFVMALLFVAVKSKRRTPQALKGISKNANGLMSGLFMAAGSLPFFYCAAKAGDDVLIVIVIAATAPLMASLLSAVFDHERLGYAKRLGGVLVVVGIVLLNVLK